MSKELATKAAELTAAQQQQLASLGDGVATHDLTEAPAENWKHARPFSKPRKEAISLRLDADVLDWLRHRSERYQTEINRILRETMEAEARR